MESSDIEKNIVATQVFWKQTLNDNQVPFKDFDTNDTEKIKSKLKKFQKIEDFTGNFVTKINEDLLKQ